MNTLGIIFSYTDRANLRELTKRRTLSSLPIAGKYRMIDVILSNYVNSGVTDVSIITKDNYHSLMDHVGAGKEWDLTRKKGGLRVLTPFSSPEMPVHAGMYRGDVEALSRNMHSIRRSMAEYVVLSGSGTLYSMNYKDVVEKHIETKADITAVYTRSMNGSKIVPPGVVIFDMDEDGKIKDLKYNTNGTEEQDAAWGIGAVVIKKSLLESLVADAMSYQEYDFYEGIMKRLASTLNIRGYEYTGYVMEISSVTDYMNANMALLDSAMADKFFEKPIYTKIKDSVPVQYCDGCKVKNSIIADGCKIEGTVENSIISRGVRIGKGTVVKNSIVMQNTEIMENVVMDHVILDKDVIVRENRQLIGHETYPVLVEKLSIV